MGQVQFCGNDSGKTAALTYAVLVSPPITAIGALNEFSRNLVKEVFPVTVKIEQQFA
jgi:hypothetical protein